MFKIIKSSHYKSLIGENSELVSIRNHQRRKLEELLRERDEKLEEIDSLSEELIASRKEIEELKNKIEKMSVSENDNTVTVVIDKSLDKVKPIIRFDPTIEDSLQQANMIPDFDGDNTFSIQLALMTIANEGLAQILESFERGIDDE